MKPTRLEIQADTAEIYSDMQSAYQETLSGPLDDMWGAFADAALPYALLLDGKVVGFCSVNDACELLSFHLTVQHEDLAETFLGYLIERLDLVAAVASTVDPGFLSPGLGLGRGAVAVALMFRHVLEPLGHALSGLRLASTADHAAAVAFDEAAIAAPRSFLEPYLLERIERGELLLHEKQDEILAIGECRMDQKRSGFAHLGIVVGQVQRGLGLGSSLLHALVLESRGRGAKPLCSTEPGNLAAVHAIHKAGFRSRHRVFRVELGR